MRQKSSNVRALATVAIIAALGALGVVIFQADAERDSAPETASQPASSVAPAPVAQAAPPQSAVKHAPSETNTRPDTASSEASWREARQAAIQVQQRLRTQELARKEAQRNDARNERCVGGRRIRRVENGWVEAGPC